MVSTLVYRQDRQTIHLILIAGGATACITAGRLAEADPNLKILVRLLLSSLSIDFNLVLVDPGSWSAH